MNRALTLAIAGTLKPVVKTGIVLAGGATGAFTGPQLLNLGGAGLRVGDVALVVVDMIGTGAAITMSGTGAHGDVFAAQSYDSAAASAHAMWYVATAADATNGQITFQVAGAGAWSLVGIVLRNVDPVTPLDTTPSVATGSDAASGGAMAAPGITTVTDDCLFLYALLTHTGTATPTFGTPAAFTALAVEAATAPYQMVASAFQITAGASPAVAGSLLLNPDGPVGWLASLIALRPLAPDIVLTEDLGTLKVGEAFTGSVTATYVGGAHGDIILTASNLPAGLTLGTKTDNGDDSYTWSVTGTPTTQGAFSASFSATNGVHTDAYTWSGTVAANPMTLTGTLPNAIIGQAYHDELTLGGYYQTPVAIDASSGTIPSWMTVTVDGATVNFDATAANVPSAAEMDSFTVRATDSSATPQVATSAQTVSVANTVNVKVTIDHTKVTEDLTDFPVYVDLSDMPAAFWDKVKNRGSDIRCYAGATELPREVVHCDRTAKVGELWIKADLSATADTVLTIKADGQSDEPAFTAANGRDAVWSNGFAAVWHMQQGMASDNWLLNPGAETGDTTSWILESGAALRITGSDSSLTAVGGYMFLGGHGDAVLYQDVDVTAQFDTSAIDAGTTGVRFAAVLGSAYTGDFGQLLLQCLDGTGAVLSTDSTALQDPYEVAGNAVWMPVSITKMLPAGTRTVRCKLGWHLGAGSYANTAFDSCTLSAAAAPVAAQTDSTGNGNSLTPIGTFAAGAAAAGQVGNALSFSGSNNAQALDAPSLDMGTGDLTLSMWLSPASLSTIKQALIDKGDGSTSGYRLFVSDSSATKLTLVRGSAYADGVDSSAMLAAGWQLVHAAATGAAAAFYRNGVAAGTGTLANTSWTNANAVQVGYRGYSGSSVGYYTGQLDEVRIAAAHRSQGWAAAEYANQSTPTTFYTVT